MGLVPSHSTLGVGWEHRECGSRDPALSSHTILSCENGTPTQASDTDTKMRVSDQGRKRTKTQANEHEQTVPTHTAVLLEYLNSSVFTCHIREWMLRTLLFGDKWVAPCDEPHSVRIDLKSPKYSIQYKSWASPGLSRCEFPT